jgi:hypothetical protein
LQLTEAESTAMGAKGNNADRLGSLIIRIRLPFLVKRKTGQDAFE